MKTTNRRVLTAGLVATVFLSLSALPAQATTTPSVTAGAVYCDTLALAPNGVAVATPATSLILVNLPVVHVDCLNYPSGTYSISVTDCAGEGDSETAGPNARVFNLQAFIHRSAWATSLAISCTLEISTPYAGGGDTGGVVIAHTDISVICPAC